MDIRQRLYNIEKQTLSPYAALACDTKGRAVPIEESDVRTEFMRDRDRIVHSKSFRRLKDKAQVFLNPENSHYRTRLTHTMEVSQIARTISRALMLNEDLTEAIALGHDLGHTPFGHAGERALNNHVPFSHNKQSLRIVEKLERDGEGLNLTFEVRDGILNHKRGMKPATLEGMVVNYSDRIAYLNHDLDDVLRAGILDERELPRDSMEALGDRYSTRINSMILDVVKTSLGKPYVAMSDEMAGHVEILRNFMFERVYVNSAAMREEQKVHHLIDLLFEYYLEHTDELPGYIAANIERDGNDICVADHIAGMTDKYAVAMFTKHFIPKSPDML